MQKATFAAGCFWHVEDAFMKTEGVISTKAGFTGGRTKKPTYHQVCYSDTGHAEAVDIEYDEKQISYEELLGIFWSLHDPTEGDRQGLNFGSQYRSAIFYHSEQQKKSAEKSKEKEQKKYKKPITTQIIKAPDFYMAEDYHQQYEEKGRQKLRKFKFWLS